MMLSDREVMWMRWDMKTKNKKKKERDVDTDVVLVFAVAAGLVARWGFGGIGSRNRRLGLLRLLWLLMRWRSMRMRKCGGVLRMAFSFWLLGR